MHVQFCMIFCFLPNKFHKEKSQNGEFIKDASEGGIIKVVFIQQLHKDNNLNKINTTSGLF